MLVERSTDYGRTWKVFKYFAKDCATSFPDITSGRAQGVGDVVCDSKYSHIEPSTGGEVVLKVLDPNFEIENPYSPYIQDLVTLTNLRINFTKLHTLGDTLLGRKQKDSLDKYYYALYKMVVRGSCFCNGHASECGPVQKVRGDVFSPPGMVHGQCVCQHNTDGPNCERCKDFFQDAPWRPAEGFQDSSCRLCDCNSHSERCHFDMTTYLASGGRSGGVCEDCQHNTEGQHCDACRPFFYRDPLKAISNPYACIPCECDPDGTISGGICVSHSDSALGSVAGQCLCKENVEGAKCHQCKPNHYGLSATDPLGCQPCDCNSLGSLTSSTCDVETGQCLCQSFATGPHCEECIVGYWGLGNHLHECSPCDCDIGGAYSNVCSPEDGQCECRPHISGRSCTEPAPGYFFASLNFYLYEAEEAMPLQGLAPLILATAWPECDVYFQQQGNDFTIDKGNIILKRNHRQSMSADKQNEGTATSSQIPAVHIVFRELVPGSPVTWTGPGFARVLPGAGLRFSINNIPFPMNFTIVIGYEIQSTADWTVRIVVNSPGRSRHCPPKTLKPRSFALPVAARIVLLPTPICLEPDIQYFIDVYFSQTLEGQSHAHSHILVDSLGLIPQINSLENFCSKQDLDEYQLYNCVDIASETGPQVLPGACERLVISMSAMLHNGAVACKCHPQGSVGPSCSRLGGQCQCRPGVVGRCCDRCSAGSYGLGQHGCHSCHCNPQGSQNTLCDQITGQCSCHGEVAGRRCDRCLAGYFGFPNCRPCPCNGFAELCDPETGSCFNCGGFTAGENCERCINGYYGNPSLGQSCHPCPCPDVPSSNQYFAHSCYQNPWSSDVICSCLHGYAGIHCGECSSGFYGNPRISGAPCRPCACNNNIDVTDPESCSQVTGECLRCLHNTEGPNCQLCKPGHFGSAFNQTCRTCDCNREGTQEPICDQDTGVCHCRTGVSGQRCDRCAQGHSREFPSCLRCHLCFDQWDHTSSSLSEAVQGLMKLAANMEDKREILPVCEADFKGLQENISEIERILRHSVFSSEEFLKVKDYQDSVRKQIIQLSEQMKTVYEFQGLKETIERIRNEAELLVKDLQEEIDFHSSAYNASIMDYSENIKKHYQISSSAEKKSKEATSILNNSENTRNALLTILHTLSEKGNMSLEKLKQIEIPSIQILNEKVCGRPGNMPCELARCGGALCKGPKGHRHCGGPNCQGSLALSSNAFQKAKKTESLIHNLDNQTVEFKNQIKNISTLAEVSMTNALQLSEKLGHMKNQSASEEEKMNLLIKRTKTFLLEENIPPEDIEKLANRVLDIHLPITSQNLTQELDEIRKLKQLCEDYRTDENRLNKIAVGSQKLLVKATLAEKTANVLLNLDKMLNKLQLVQITQGRANSTITQLTAEIAKIENNILQAESQANETKKELDRAKQQSELKDGFSLLHTKLQRNRDQAMSAKAQAESAQHQAGGIEKEFVELKKQYAVLQHKTFTTGLTKEALGKMKQLKDEAEKLAGDTEDKMRRITDLEKKIRDLNLSKQEKADQLRQLEDQVTAIKDEIIEQENKYATCYS
ncbi:laminin subunit beta-4 isoform X2 [Tamandua tetradactyla]